MTTKHKKKRNSLLLYEFLVRMISRALVEDDKKKSSAALKILKRHFRPGTELYREFRLMNALAKTTVSSENVAASILKEAKEASRAFDDQRLDREKSLLIRNINHGLNEPDFYDQQISEYKMCATIQTLINEWKKDPGEKDVGAIATYEDVLVRHLITKKDSDEGPTVSESSNGTARLLMKVMTKKLNEKYGETLNEQQKSLVKAYAYSAASDDSSSIKLKLAEIKSDLLGLVDGYIAECKDNSYLRNKVEETKSTLLMESLEVVDDDVVTRFMLYSRLKDELESKE